MAPELRHLLAPGRGADPGASRPVPAPSSSPSVPSLPLRFPAGSGVSPPESCCGWVSPRRLVSPPLVAVWGLPGLDSPPPSSSATSGAWSPCEGRHPGLSSSSSESHGVGGRQKPRLWDHPGASSLAPALSGQRFPLPKHPNPSSAPGGAGPPPGPCDHRFWVSPALLSSGIPGLGEGGVSITRQRLSRGQGWGGSWCRPPSQKTRDCLWSVEPHRRVCTLQILQQNIF